ncbi:MAG: hypothetical protein WCQ72_04600 [Eubacteriales bacterium]
MTEYNPFVKALPVWAEGTEREMNITCRFTAAVETRHAALRIAASTLYRAFVNGVLAGYGPARGPHGYYRVDELDITPYLTREVNNVVVEVAGYNSNSFYVVDVPSFIQAELTDGGVVLACTSDVACERGDTLFTASYVTERRRKIQRFSFQRPFMEAWSMTPDYMRSLDRTVSPESALKLVRTEKKTLLARHVPFATLAALGATEIVGDGSVAISPENLHPWGDRSLVNIGEQLKGFKKDELELCLTDDAGHYAFTLDSTAKKPYCAVKIAANRFVNARFKQNYTGFVSFHAVCSAPVTLILLFDELLTGGDVNFWRMGTCNILRFDLAAGEYDITTMECFTMQFVKMMALGGECEVSKLHLVEYAAPDTNMCSYTGENPTLGKIWDAGVQTYRQNAVDLYTDCPCRERAGWLCDSFFTSRTEYALTGKSTVEHNFLENFVLPDSFKCLPKGMFPMCYPSDFYNGEYIPNWAMWLVMEVREYKDRGGDAALIEAFKPKIYALFDFLDGYLNSDGLLEKLDSWVFVEWSRANDLVQDVNYPSNMLYAAAKQAAGELYGDAALIKTAAAMRDTITRQSFDGSFFTDHSVRGEDGELHNDGEATEVCQYYAFTCGVASPEKYPALWKTLVEDFGPHRRENNKYPKIAFANAFIGNYLRLDLLYKYSSKQEVVDNIEGYFKSMAEKTGTLWEMDNECASLDHGFASHVIVWIKGNM